MDPLELLSNFGGIGVAFGLVVFGYLIPKPQHERVVIERDRAWRQRDEIIDDVHTNVAPALEKATEAILSREALEDLVIEVLVDVRRLLERRT